MYKAGGCDVKGGLNARLRDDLGLCGGFDVVEEILVDGGVSAAPGTVVFEADVVVKDGEAWDGGGLDAVLP